MDPETQRLINLLKVCLKILGIPNREVARRMGISPSYLSKLFSGGSELRLDHLVRICRAIGLEPAEFFTLAYPRQPRSGTATAAQLRELLQQLPAPPPPEPPQEPAVPDERMQQMMKEMLENLLKRNTGT
jgi:transcriptional regulator with XRE-family HTH domain